MSSSWTLVPEFFLPHHAASTLLVLAQRHHFFHLFSSSPFPPDSGHSSLMETRLSQTMVSVSLGPRFAKKNLNSKLPGLFPHKYTHPCQICVLIFGLENVANISEPCSILRLIHIQLAVNSLFHLVCFLFICVVPNYVFRFCH